MAIQTKPRTLAEFIGFVELPENEGREFELISGEVLEMTPSRTRNSGIALRLVIAVDKFCVEHGIICEMSGADGTYLIGDNAIVPDFAYKRTPLSDDYPDPVAPLWAVEVVSPTETAPKIREKREIYIEAGILAWEIYPRMKRVDVYAPGQAPRSVGVDGVLDGSEVLPGFTLPVKKLFPE